jgi:hypothetical protein
VLSQIVSQGIVRVRSRVVASALRVTVATMMLALGIGAAAIARPAADEEETPAAAGEEMPDEDSTPPKKSKSTAKAKTSKSAKSPAKANAISAKAKTKSAVKSAGSPLKYGFSAGEKYVYEVQVEVDFGDSTRTLSGHSTYTVKSADDDEIVLEHDGTLVGREQKRGGPTRFDPRHRGAFASLPNHYAGRGEVTIDTSGKVLKNTSQVQLPFLLGPLATLVLEPLSPQGEPTWQTSSDLAVGSKAQPSRSGPGSMRTRSRISTRGAPQPQTPAFVSAANESAQYKRGAAKGDLVKITKHLELKSTQAPADTGIPTLEKTSDGEIIFDNKAGVPKKTNIKESLQVTLGSIQGKVPLTLTCRLLSAEEVAKLDQEAADNRAKLEAAEAERNRPLNDDDVRQALADLKSPDKRRSAADRLAKGPASEQREKVAKALGTLLKDPDDGMISSAAKALSIWGTPESVPPLVKILNNSENVFVKSDVMKTLGELKDERGAEAIAKQLPFDRGNASRALQAIGPAAESHVIPYLEDRDGGVRGEAAKILGAIGTQKSVPALEKLAKSGKVFEARDAEKAIKQIESRE